MIQAPGNSYLGGRLSTIYLLVLTSLEQLLLMSTFFYKTSYLNVVASCTEPTPSVNEAREY